MLNELERLLADKFTEAVEDIRNLDMLYRRKIIRLKKGLPDSPKIEAGIEKYRKKMGLDLEMGILK